MLLCFGLLLACIPEKVYGIRNIVSVLRWKEEPETKKIGRARYLRNTCISSEKLDARENSVVRPSPFDANTMSERRVQKGSDPIHNRC